MTPQTLDECFEYFDRMWSEADLHALRETPLEDLGDFRFAAGQELADFDFDLWNSESPLFEDLESRGCSEADQMGQYIFEQYWRHLNGMPVKDLRESVGSGIAVDRASLT